MKTALGFLIAMALCFNPPGKAAAQWVNYQTATYSIGQPDFTSIAPMTTAGGVRYPSDAAIDVVHHKLYIADDANYRVLRYAYPFTVNQPQAELVFGQIDLVTGQIDGGDNIGSPNTLDVPGGLAVYDGALWICDWPNHRVLRFDNAWALTKNGPNADGVLGDTILYTGQFGGDIKPPSALNIVKPAGLAFDRAGNLFVADQFGHRVLRFNDAMHRSNGAPADGVLGQQDLTTADSSFASNRLNRPYGLAIDSDGTTLFVSDQAQNRILRFDHAANKPNGSAPDGVLGQLDLSSRDAATTVRGLSQPSGLAIDNQGRLYVADYKNYRLLMFSAAKSKSNGADADIVLGQKDFTSRVYTVNQHTVGGTTGVAVEDKLGYLFVIDEYYSRALQFTSTPSDVESYSANSAAFQLCVFPNPMTSSAMIELSLAETSDVVLTLEDVLGREARRVLTDRLSTGVHRLALSATGLPQGVYNCRFQAGSRSATHKVIFTK